MPGKATNSGGFRPGSTLFSLAISESFDLLGLQIASPVLKHPIIDGRRTAVRPVRRMLG